MSTNEIIVAIKALKVGDEVTVNGRAVVKYGKKNYQVFAGAAYASASRTCADAYAVAMEVK